MKVAKVTNLNRLINELKERKIWTVGASGDATMNYDEWDWKQPSALVLGAEGSGLHRLVAENCDVLVKIPMYGRIESLNVSVAAGVVLFEAKRQRTERSKASFQGSMSKANRKPILKIELAKLCFVQNAELRILKRGNFAGAAVQILACFRRAERRSRGVDQDPYLRRYGPEVAAAERP